MRLVQRNWMEITLSIMELVSVKLRLISSSFLRLASTFSSNSDSSPLKSLSSSLIFFTSSSLDFKYKRNNSEGTIYKIFTSQYFILNKY